MNEHTCHTCDYSTPLYTLENGEFVELTMSEGNACTYQQHNCCCHMGTIVVAGYINDIECSTYHNESEED